MNTANANYTRSALFMMPAFPAKKLKTFFHIPMLKFNTSVIVL